MVQGAPDFRRISPILLRVPQPDQPARSMDFPAEFRSWKGKEEKRSGQVTPLTRVWPVRDAIPRFFKELRHRFVHLPFFSLHFHFQTKQSRILATIRTE